MWKCRFVRWLRTQPWTRIGQKWQQYYGERFRSWRAQREPDTNLPFPYNNPVLLNNFEENKKMAEPDHEAYWREQQRILDLKHMYSKAKLLQGYPWADFLTLIP